VTATMPAASWRGRATVQAGLAAVALVASLALALPDGPVRAALTLAAVLVAPGAAVTGFTRFTEPTTEAIVALTASITVAVFAGQLMLWLHQWRPEPLFLVVSLTSAVALVHHARSGPRPSPGATIRPASGKGTTS